MQHLKYIQAVEQACRVIKENTSHSFYFGPLLGTLIVIENTYNIDSRLIIVKQRASAEVFFDGEKLGWLAGDQLDALMEALNNRIKLNPNKALENFEKFLETA